MSKITINRENVFIVTDQHNKIILGFNRTENKFLTKEETNKIDPLKKTTLNTATKTISKLIINKTNLY